MKSIDIIIPIKNEEMGLESLVKSIDLVFQNSKSGYRLILVDDRSQDKSIEVIKRLVKSYPIVLHRKVGKPGKAFCILEGAAIAKSDYVVMIDADLQYSPAVIPQMVRIKSRYGVVVANRKVYQGSMTRRIASRLNALVFGKIMFGLDCDVQSGLKLFRRSLINEVDLSVIGPWSLDIPLLYAAIRKGYAIGGVEITFLKRNEGETKIKFFKTALEIARGAVLLRLRNLGLPLVQFSGRKFPKLLGRTISW